MSFKRATIRDFWAEVRVDPIKRDGFTECWVFCGTPAYSGYRAFRSILAHRAAAALYCGKIPVTVRQRCGNRECVRFEHLTINTESTRKVKQSPIRRNAIFRDERPDTVKQILNLRGEGSYKYADIAEKAQTTADKVKKVLREAPLYDLIAERSFLESRGEKVQLSPERLTNVKA